MNQTRMETLRSAKGYRAGTHRLVAPEQTLERIKPLTRAMGITRVATITGLDVIGIPVVAVMRPNSRSIAVSQGKGLDLTAAKVSGLMESIENYHAERIRLPLTLATWREMRERGPTLAIERLPRVAGSSLHDGTRMLWLQGHEIFEGQPTMLPFEVVHADYTLPLPTCSGALVMSDSGVASGNDPLEATSHAICELVERDSLTLFRFLPSQEQARRRVLLSSIDDEACRSVLELYARADVQAAVWDVTSDIGIPSFFCTILDREPNHFRALGPSSGSGSHPCREVALLRALTEAAQARLTVIAGSRDDVGLATYRRGQDRAVLAEAQKLLATGGEQRHFDDIPT
ncbi:MAG TPA: YcaO-like family protein, partial [Polyangiaceae bacterium]|nr:YcaO-like family protein [Polyangiaceae bacterium]